jgi:hypothetical protein
MLLRAAYDNPLYFKAPVAENEGQGHPDSSATESEFPERMRDMDTLQPPHG